MGDTIEDLFGAVTIVNPGGAYTLATEHSPLPLALRNDLAVPINVRLDVEAPPGMTVTDIGDQELPPGYLPLRIPGRGQLRAARRHRRHTANPNGLQLGEPVRLSVHSNAYGRCSSRSPSPAARSWRCWSGAASITGSEGSRTVRTSTGLEARAPGDPCDAR